MGSLLLRLMGFSVTKFVFAQFQPITSNYNPFSLSKWLCPTHWGLLISYISKPWETVLFLQRGESHCIYWGRQDISSRAHGFILKAPNSIPGPSWTLQSKTSGSSKGFHFSVEISVHFQHNHGSPFLIHFGVRNAPFK